MSLSLALVWNNISAQTDFRAVFWIYFVFLTAAMRPSLLSSMYHSKVSPSLSPRNTAMPSGTVALSEVDPGLAIDTFDLSFMV